MKKFLALPDESSRLPIVPILCVIGLLLASVCFAQTDQISVRALGTMGGENPELRIDGNLVTSWTMTTSYVNYSANGSGEVELHFTNDDQVENGMDIQVDYIEYHGTILQFTWMVLVVDPGDTQWKLHFSHNSVVTQRGRYAQNVIQALGL